MMIDYFTDKVQSSNQFGTHTCLVQALIHVLITADHVLRLEPPPAVTLRMSLFHVVSIGKILMFYFLKFRSGL